MKPNILLFVADQFRGDSLACDGNAEIKTPNYDALAARGVRFPNAFTPCPICVPARATLITGKYPHNGTGKKSNEGALPAEIAKLPELLVAEGYRTYASGKLHYHPYAAPGQPRTLHGFQEAKLAESGRIIAKYDQSGQTPKLEDYFDYLGTVGWGGYTRAHGVGNNDIHPAPSPLPGEHTVDGWVATEGINYIDQHLENAADQPFFIKVSFPKPHAPFDPPRPYDSMYDPRELSEPAQQKDSHPRSPDKQIESAEHGWNYISPEGRQVIKSHYYGQISFQDSQVGRVMEHLKAKGLSENTYVIFVSDHGEMLGDFGYYFKSCMYEGSIRVPMLISGPGIKPGVNEALVGLEDLTPTITELLATELPEAVDGISLAPLLRGADQKERSCYVAYCNESPQQTYMVRTHTHKYIYNEFDGIEELYDLIEDPKEEINRIDDPSLKELHHSLQQELIAWAIKHGDTHILKDGQLAKSSLPKEPASFKAGVMGWRHY
jgi:choline-sulfatase